MAGPPDAAWFARLDDAWRAVFAEQCGVDTPAKAKKLASVRDIYLNDTCDVTTLAPLAKLTKLREINCDAKRVTDLSPLTALPGLEALRITSPIASFAPLAKMTKLRSLELNDTPIADLTPIARLANLHRLELNDTPVTDLTPLAKLAKLEHLELNGTAVEDLTPIAGLDGIEHLEIARTKVRDLAMLADWHELSDLVIASCPIPREGFEALAALDGLRTLNLAHTAITSLAPIDSHSEIHILHLDGTPLTFAEILRYRQVRGVKPWDSLTRLDVYCDFGKLDAFLAAIEQLGSVRGVEPVFTAWINDVFIALLRDEEKVALAPKLLEHYFALEVAPNEYTKEIAGNALHLIVTQKVDPVLEKRVLEELVPQATMNRRLAFNLACYHAKRGTKAEVLRIARLALELGQEAAGFHTDPDFASLRGDPDFEALLATNFTPDPYTAPAAWWASLPEDLKSAFWMLDVDEDGGEPDDDAIRAMLEQLDELQLDEVRSLDPLRGLRIRRLDNRECKASSLAIIPTLQGLEELRWKKDEYLGGTRLADLGPLADVTTLRVLEMPGHLFTNLDAIAGLTQLTKLDVRQAPLVSIEGVRDLTLLEELSLDAPTGGALDLTPLERLANLRTLWLHGPVQSFEPIGKLRSLEKLGMQRCTLADGSPVPLAPLHGLTKLQNLWVGSAREAEAKRALKKVIPGCKIA